MADPYASFSTPVNKADPYAGIAARSDAISGGVQDYEPTQYTTGEKAARAGGLAAQGFNDAIANAVGAPVDAASWLLRHIGLPIGTNPIGGSESLKRGIDYLASIPGKVGITTEGAPVRFQPNNAIERGAYGAGEGAGNALTIAIPAGMIGRAAPVGSFVGGIANALAAQPVMQTIAGATQGGVTEATGNPLLGLAAGAAVPVVASVGRGVISPTTNRLTPQEARLAAAAQNEGIELTPAQLTGSPTLQTVERTMESLPGSSGPMKQRFGSQRGQFNEAVLKRAGITANEASPDVIEGAFVRLGNDFDNLAKQTTLNVDNQFVNDVRNVAHDYGRRLDTSVAPIFKSYMDDLEPLLQAATTPGANPQMAGDIYARIRSDIGRTIRSATDNPNLQRALGGIQNALDGVVERSTSGGLRQDWQEARREYQALMTIDKSMRGGTQTDRIRADIPLNALRHAVVQADPSGFSRGRGQLNELSRIGDFLASRVPDSGTPARLAVSNPLMWPVVGAYRIAGGLYNTPLAQSYLTNQLAGQTNFPALYAGQLARQALAEGDQGDTALINHRVAP